ncbi:MAG: sugar ABC transporter permease [Limnochordaceae bacterium]|nr:sugar ABC transporter permease [Limnochordaceae bacterium]
MPAVALRPESEAPTTARTIPAPIQTSSGLRSFWSNRNRRYTALMGYAFIAPVMIYVTVVHVGPIVASLYLSFTRYQILTPPVWVGVGNYRRILLDDPLFWPAMRTTAQYSLEVLPLNIVLSLGLALLVNRAVRGIALFRTLYYLPVVTSIIAVSMIWLWLYEPRSGLLNLLLDRLGMGPVNWLGDPELALHSLVLMRVWRGIGWNMVIYLAGLQGIPHELYEAVELDGGSAFKKFRHVTWPLLRPVTYYIVVMGLISTFQTFAEVYAMTGGGPLGRTTTVAYLIYQRAFQYFEMGEASSVAFSLAMVIFGLSLINVRYFRSAVE